MGTSVETLKTVEVLVAVGTPVSRHPRSCGRNAHCCAPRCADPDLVARPFGSYLG